MCADAGVEIPLYLHAGETLGDGDETDENLFDALLLGAKRIGHGYSMYKHPHLMNICKTRGVCLEVCPISNEILRLTSSIMGHTLPAVLAHGVPVALSNDDPGILGQKTTSSLSHDYWQVLQAFNNVGLEGLGDIAETGVKYAAFDTEGEVGAVIPGSVREERLKDWQGRWERFCEWVVTEFEDWETKEK
jgi:adenosine deaminase CECR1